MAIASVGKLRSKPETARILGISLATLDRRIADGSINYFKQGARVCISDEQISEYLSHCLNAPRQRSAVKRQRKRAA